MKAVLCKEFGPPESLVVEDVASPEPGPGEVVLDVHAAAVNFPDVLIIQNKYQFKPPLPFSPGGEVAGVVSKLGEGVTNLKIGDRVIGSCGNGGFVEELAIAEAACIPPRQGTRAPLPVSEPLPHAHQQEQAHPLNAVREVLAAAGRPHPRRQDERDLLRPPLRGQLQAQVAGPALVRRLPLPSLQVPDQGQGGQAQRPHQPGAPGCCRQRSEREPAPQPGGEG